MDPGKSSHEYYYQGAPEIPESMRALLIEYSGVADEQIVQHVKQVRDQAWNVFQYPCLGVYAFLNLTIADVPQYSALLHNVKNGWSFLDLGCCFGQVIRKLVYDGAPGENLIGSELQPEFVELGYELFRDRQKLTATFTVGDFFDEDIGGLKGRTFDYIYGGAFFHLFTWQEQVEAISRAVLLLKQKPGSTIMGWQTGAREARARLHATARSGELYSHNEKSLGELMSEVAEKTGVKLRTTVNMLSSATTTISSDNGDWQFLRFSITRC